MEQQVCQFCSAKVPAANMLTHEAYCARSKRWNNRQIQSEKVLPTCDCQAVGGRLTAGRHLQGCHLASFTCPYCQMDFQKNNEAQHLLMCNLKPMCCQYCHMTLMQKNYANHMIRCQQMKQKKTERGENRRVEFKVDREERLSIDKKCIKRNLMRELNRLFDPSSNTKIQTTSREARSQANIESKKTISEMSIEPNDMLPVCLVTSTAKQHTCFYDIKPVSILPL